MVISNMAVLKWRLRLLLEQHQVKPYRLAKAMGVPPKHIYRWTNHTPKNIDLATVERIITALRVLTGCDIEVSDLLEYEV
jgi:DNA-binding Xre family transcriptional regulator